jgi:hypothetical protein
MRWLFDANIPTPVKKIARSVSPRLPRRAPVLNPWLPLFQSIPQDKPFHKNSQQKKEMTKAGKKNTPCSAAVALETQVFENDALALKQLTECSATMTRDLTALRDGVGMIAGALASLQVSLERMASVGPNGPNPLLAGLSADMALFIAKISAVTTAGGGGPESAQSQAGQQHQQLEAAGFAVDRADVPTFARMMDHECVQPLQQLGGHVAALNRMKATRRLTLENYNLHQGDVDRKVADYQRRGKDLATSETLAELNEKAAAAHKSYDGAVQAFNFNMENLFLNKDGMVGRAVDGALEHVAGILSVLGAGAQQLFDASAMSRAVHDGQRARAALPPALPPPPPMSPPTLGVSRSESRRTVVGQPIRF